MNTLRFTLAEDLIRLALLIMPNGDTKLSFYRILWESIHGLDDMTRKYEQ